MICAPCRSIHFVLNATVPHHLTCRSLKQSVDLGCYTCNRLWATLTPDEQRLVSYSDGTTVSTAGAATNSVEDCITQSSVMDGGPYGHPKSYLLSLAFNASAVLSPETVLGRAYWRACFILQLSNGTVILNFIDLKKSRRSAILVPLLLSLHGCVQ
jgi:hypothetical protein